MQIGAASMVRARGVAMSLSRDGSVLVGSFMGCRAEIRPSSFDADMLDYSVEQELFIVIAAAEDLGDVRPQKFDVIIIGDKTYTVQRGRAPGAQTPELVKFIVKGGNV